MDVGKKNRRKARVNTDLCVACGCCTKVCPLRAIDIYHGLYAQINEEKCVGCGKCVRECPASVITVVEVEA
jgi:Pyruvate/2-oxoacid:ferredoxin oxidoreductase delta subunit